MCVCVCIGEGVWGAALSSLGLGRIDAGLIQALTKEVIGCA